MAANILTHAHASTQGKYRPPTDISEHFERILYKYARFLTLPCCKLHRNVHTIAVVTRKTSD